MPKPTPMCTLKAKIKITRLHSSRMRTARALTVSPSMLCQGVSASWGVVCSRVGGGVSASWGSAPGGGVCSRGRVVCSRKVSASRGCVYSQGSVCFLGVSAHGGCLLPGGGVCLLGGCLPPGGVSASGGVASQRALRQTPPPCEQNHTHL